MFRIGIFDKTGTLTYSLPSVRRVSGQLTENEKFDIVDGKRDSHHPVAFCLSIISRSPIREVIFIRKEKSPESVSLQNFKIKSQGPDSGMVAKKINSIQYPHQKKVGLYFQDQVQIEFELEEGFYQVSKICYQRFKKGEEIVSSFWRSGRLFCCTS